MVTQFYGCHVSCLFHLHFRFDDTEKYFNVKLLHTNDLMVLCFYEILTEVKVLTLQRQKFYSTFVHTGIIIRVIIDDVNIGSLLMIQQ